MASTSKSPPKFGLQGVRPDGTKTSRRSFLSNSPTGIAISQWYTTIVDPNSISIVIWIVYPKIDIIWIARSE